MLRWIAKKFIIGRINDLLEEYKDNIGKVKSTLLLWTERLEKVLACLKKALTKLDDNKLDEDELKEAVDDVTSLVKEW